MVDLTSRSMRSIDPHQLQVARELAHNAIQWLARFANSYVPAEPEHRHVLLDWRPDRRALVTRPVAHGISLELRLPDLHLQFARNGQLEAHVLDIEDHTPAEVEAWFLIELLHRDIDRSRFSKHLPYSVPGLLTGDSIEYSPASCMPALAALTDWLEQGAAILANLAPAGATLQCWPETLQIGRLLPLEAGQASGQPMLRVGISAGDGLCPEPFFFVMPDESGARGQPPHPGTILPASRILAEPVSPASVTEFLVAARAANRNRLLL